MADIRTPQFWVNLLKKVLKNILKNFGVRTSPPTHNQHVVPHPDGWAIKGAGNERYTAVFDYQDDAIDKRNIKVLTRFSFVFLLCLLWFKKSLT